MIIYLCRTILIGVIIGALILGFETGLEWILDKAFDNNPNLAVGFVIFILLCGILVKFKSIFKYYKKSEENKKQIHNELKLLLICIPAGIIIGFIIRIIISFTG